MPLIHLDFFSDTLKMAVNADVIIPYRSHRLIGMETAETTDTYPTLYLLHGLSDDHTIWQRRTSIERYAAARNIAVVMPNAHRSWYTDMAHGGAYYTFIAEELPRICRHIFRGMSDKKEDNFIAGLSMGGYGALKIALSKPDCYAAAASLSGALDIAGKLVNSSLERRTEWEDVFGDLNAFTGSQHDVYALTDRLAAAGQPFPRLYLWCGTEDFLLDSNRKMHEKLQSLGVEHTYEESPGNHSWPYWDDKIQRALAFFFD